MVINIQDDILKIHALGLLDSLLEDKTTGRHILWASDAYSDRGPAYEKERQITSALITGDNADVIKTRARKSMEQQSERTRKHGEVFTPVWVCKKMNDHIDEVWFRRKTGFNKTDENNHVFFPKGKTWQQYADNRRMEITCGEAPFLVSRYDPETGEMIPIPQRVGILDRKLRVVSENAATEEEWFTWAIRALQATYGYEFQGDSLLIGRVNVLMTFEEYLSDRWNRKLTLEEYRTIIRIITWNIWQMDGLTGLVPYSATENDQLTLFEIEPKQPSECRIHNWRQRYSSSYLTMKGERARMRFKFLTGNPPYQEERQGDSNTATPVYNSFMDGAYEVSDKAMLITPARFLFNAGYTPKAWNKKMLNDEHLKVMAYMADSGAVFQGVDIKGGVAITYRDISQKFGAIRIFTQYPEINKILHKVLDYETFESLMGIIVTSFAYHYTKVLYDEHPELIGRSSKGHDFDVQSNAFSVFPEVFFDEKPDKDDYIRILGRDGTERRMKYIKRRYITDVANLDSYKAFYAKATGTGQFGEVLPEAIMGEPGDGNTVTFLSIGNFKTDIEAKNCVQYTKTKFARAMLSVLKVTQDNTPGKWQYVPLQDFTPASDIDWSKSIPEIDQQLYTKYGLSEEEIAFIESHVKEMV